MGPLAVSVHDLGKRYHIGAIEDKRHNTLRDAIADTMTAPFRKAAGLLRGHATAAAKLDQEIWALNGVSFDVPEGQVLGIIGPNGAGKSTLLKVLSRITEPTRGHIDIRGRVSALLEVGTGFHQELTGRENVYLNAAILGMTRSEINRKFDEIVEFAGVSNFVETPVKHYSSGMSLRLAFAVAAHLEPEILIIDEVLAVGDANFQQKCIGKMGEVAQQGRTVLFVSHNMSAVNQLCTRAIWIDQGQVRMDGAPEDVVYQYLSSGASVDGEMVWPGGVSNRGIDDFKILAVRVLNADGQVTGIAEATREFHVEIEYEVKSELAPSRIGFLLTTPDGVPVFASYDSDEARYRVPRQPGTWVSRCTIPGNLLAPKRYLINVNAGVPGTRNLAFIQGALMVDVAETGSTGSAWRSTREGVIRPSLPWVQMQRDETLQGVR